MCEKLCFLQTRGGTEKQQTENKQVNILIIIIHVFFIYLDSYHIDNSF